LVTTASRSPMASASRRWVWNACAIAESLYAEYADPTHAPPPLLRRMTAAGLLGRKTGRGFYDYQEQR